MVLERDAVRAAFREVHGARLHGFALLVALGDRRLAGRAAAEALAEGLEHADGLDHPERAAAWLRHRALQALRRRRPVGDHVGMSERRAALRGLGVGDAAYDGLAALTMVGRAALTAAAVERLAAIDIETILDADPSSVQQRVGEAKRRYLAAVPTGEHGNGDLAERIRQAAWRTMGDWR